MHLARLRVQAGHHVFDRAVLAARIHGLKNEQQGIAGVGIQQVLPVTHFFDVCGEQGVIFLFGLVKSGNAGGPLLKVDAGAFANTEWFGVNFHFSCL